MCNENSIRWLFYQLKMLDCLNHMCCSSYNIGYNGACSENNQPHQPTEDIKYSTPTQANVNPLTALPTKNIFPNTNYTKVSIIRYY